MNLVDLQCWEMKIFRFTIHTPLSANYKIYLLPKVFATFEHLLRNDFLFYEHQKLSCVAVISMKNGFDNQSSNSD